jgi:hypothetical protein
MPLPHVLVQHDDGRTYVAEVLAQYRMTRRWRALVTYSTQPGYRYHRAFWADELHALSESGGHPEAPTSHSPDRCTCRGSGPAR